MQPFWFAKPATGPPTVGMATRPAESEAEVGNRQDANSAKFAKASAEERDLQEASLTPI